MRRHVRSWRKPTPHSKAHPLVNRLNLACRLAGWRSTVAGLCGRGRRGLCRWGPALSRSFSHLELSRTPVFMGSSTAGGPRRQPAASWACWSVFHCSELSGSPDSRWVQARTRQYPIHRFHRDDFPSNAVRRPCHATWEPHLHPRADSVPIVREASQGRLFRIDME